MALENKRGSGAVGGLWRRAKWDEPVPEETIVTQVAKIARLTGTDNH